LETRLILPINTLLDGAYRIARVVGSGGFGITYEAEDTTLGMMVAIKEYYPHDFGDRDGTMKVQPRSDRHKKTFDWGRENFLQEARTLARFEHPSIVRVTRVFEANSTAYMVMRFEQGQSFEAWLKRLGREPTQDELDAIIAPLLDALQMMHDASFLHRDIAPDNIIIRDDGTPVLLDFGSARRAVAEMSRALTGIVKAGYSPHEQYSSDGRSQGPWTDIYALGATLYRAIAGKPPDEVTLRFDHDNMVPATQAGKGRYRPGFLKAIDASLKVRQSERPQSIAQLGPMLLGPKWRPRGATRIPSTHKIETAPPPAWKALDLGLVKKHWPMAATVVGVLVILYAGYDLLSAGRVESTGPSGNLQRAAQQAAERQALLDAQERQRKLDEENARKRQQAALEAQERQRQQAEEETRRKEAAAAEQRRIAALEEEKRKAEAAAEAERQRLAVVPEGEARAELVRKVQQTLKRARCYDGTLNGNSAVTQDGLDRLVANAGKRNAKLARIELAKATVGDFEGWLKDAGELKGVVCAAAPAPARPAPARPAPARPSGGGVPSMTGIQ
jgi:tRNA A-37 threonylcarbamoyl transferase component Bud32